MIVCVPLVWVLVPCAVSVVGVGTSLVALAYNYEQGKKREKNEKQADGKEQIDDEFIKRMVEKQFEEAKREWDDFEKKRADQQNSDRQEKQESEMKSAITPTKWDEIVGLQEVKELLKNGAAQPGIKKRFRCVLMVGAPGTGKTMLASAMACSTTFFHVACSTFTQNKNGYAPKEIVELLFEMADREAPSTILLDEIDLMFPKTGEESVYASVTQAFLLQMNKEDPERATKKPVTVLGISNSPWNMNEAFIRRFQKRIYVPLPNAQDRLTLIKKNLTGLNLDADVDLVKIAKKLETYSGDDICLVCREASLPTYSQTVNCEKVTITAQCFKNAISNRKTSVSKTNVEALQKWITDHGAK